MYRRTSYYRPSYGSRLAPAGRFAGRGAYYYKPSSSFLNYRAAQIQGRGGYWTKYRKYIPRLLGAGAAALTGQDIKSGYKAGAVVSKRILGWGEYTQAPWSSEDGKLVSKGNVPSMRTLGREGIRICHKECIGLITSTTGFAVNTYEVNPGLNSCFPWLSGIAHNFQEYNINALTFVYKPTCSDAISSATIASMGTVTMSSDMNVSTTAPTSTVAMLSAQFSASAKPSNEIVMPVEQAKVSGGGITNHLLVRVGDVPSGGNKQFYDDCVVYVATDSNGVASAILGQLFVSYDISFFNPATSVAGDTVLSAKLRITDTASATPLGVNAADLLTDFDNIGVSWATGSTLTIAPGNEGCFIITVFWHTGSGTSNIGALSFTNATRVDNMWVGNSTANALCPNASSTCSGGQVTSIFNITDPTKTVTVTLAATTLPAVNYCDVMITQLNPNYIL